MSTANSLITLFEKELQQTDEFLLNQNWESPSFYANWLAQTAYYVRHSTKLLALAASRYSVNDPAHHLRAIEHMREEKSHDLLAVHDLMGVGYSFDHIAEGFATRAMYTDIYYRILFESPFALYGYILALEGIAVRSADKIRTRIVKAHGKTNKVDRFLSLHGSEDPDHIDKAFEMVANLDSRSVAIVQETMLSSFESYRLMVEQAGAPVVLMRLEKSSTLHATA